MLPFLLSVHAGYAVVSGLSLVVTAVVILTSTVPPSRRYKCVVRHSLQVAGAGHAPMTPAHTGGTSMCMGGLGWKGGELMQGVTLVFTLLTLIGWRDSRSMVSSMWERVFPGSQFFPSLGFFFM